MSIQDLARKSNSPSDFKVNAMNFLKATSNSPKRQLIASKASIKEVIKNFSQYSQAEPEITQLTILLSEIEFSDSEEYLAAKALQMIKINAPNNGLSPKDKIEILLKTCEFFIAGKDVYSGEQAFRDLKNIKFGSIQDADAEENQFLEMRFKLVNAQYLREAGKYADAGFIYLSYVGSPRLQEYAAQRDKLIESVIVCMILAAQSPKRASLLSNLYENQVIKKHPLFELVEKTLFGNIISKEDSQTIKDKLAPSEQKMDEEGVTPLQRAVFQHNMRCLLKVYRDISFRTLGELLGISKNISFFVQLEKMIEGGFPAQIDQVSEFVTFVPNDVSEKSYNQRITAYCESIERFVGGEK